MGMATTRRPRSRPVVTWRPKLLAVGLNEFEISQRSNSVNTTLSPIVEAKVAAATLLANICVAGSTSCFAAPFEGAEAARRGYTFRYATYVKSPKVARKGVVESAALAPK